jgi:hypothetical protein
VGVNNLTGDLVSVDLLIDKARVGRRATVIARFSLNRCRINRITISICVAGDVCLLNLCAIYRVNRISIAVNWGNSLLQLGIDHAKLVNVSDACGSKQQSHVGCALCGRAITFTAKPIQIALRHNLIGQLVDYAAFARKAGRCNRCGVNRRRTLVTLFSFN